MENSYRNGQMQEVFSLITRVLIGFRWNHDIPFIDEFNKDSSSAYMGEKVLCALGFIVEQRELSQGTWC